MKQNKTMTKLVKKAEDFYVNFSEQPEVIWFRSILQSLDVEFNPSVGLKVSVGQFLERFIFTQSEIVVRKRAENAVLELNKKLKKIMVDSKNLSKKVEEYSRLFIRFYGMVGSQEYEDLRKSYTNQLANFFSSKYSKENNKLFYQQLLFRLTIDHLHVLSFANNYLGEDLGRRHENSKTLREAIKTEFTKRGLDEPLVHGLIKDLDSVGLMNATQSSLWGGDLHQLYVTALGRRLLAQIKE